MADYFRYVFEDNLYTGISKSLALENGRKVYGITCPDFNDSYFEVVETGNHSSPYLPRPFLYLNPFSQQVLGWFSDYKLLFE
jgi:hypothetical protein